MFFSQYVLQLLVVKISKSQKERSKGHKGRKGHKGHVGLHATIEWRSILVIEQDRWVTEMGWEVKIEDEKLEGVRNGAETSSRKYHFVSLS